MDEYWALLELWWSLWNNTLDVIMSFKSECFSRHLAKVVLKRKTVYFCASNLRVDVRQVKALRHAVLVVICVETFFPQALVSANFDEFCLQLPEVFAVLRWCFWCTETQYPLQVKLLLRRCTQLLVDHLLIGRGTTERKLLRTQRLLFSLLLLLHFLKLLAGPIYAPSEVTEKPHFMTDEFVIKSKRCALWPASNRMWCNFLS